jgi:hypothetical protein
MSNIDFTKHERRYTCWERMRAFTYHVWILTFGAILTPTKSKQYVEVFDEFIKSKTKKN